MSSLPVFVGLDYHKSVIQVCVMEGDGKTLVNRKVDNCTREIGRVVERLGRPVAAAAIEACCGAAALADALHARAGWSISLAHPGFVARMKQNRDKTDFGDARLLADLLRVGYLPKVWLAPEEIRQLRRLVRHRQQRVVERRNVKLRIRALLRENRIRCPLTVSAWTRAWLEWLETAQLSENDRWLMDQHLADLKRLTGQIDEVNALLAARAQDDAVVNKLMTFHGIGLVTAVTMRAEIGRFDRFRSGKQLARFCGLSPRNASSGERQADAGLVKAGNPQLRMVLIQLGQRVVQRVDGRWSSLVHRLLAHGKPKNVVVAAVANRYMRWLYHQMQPENLAA